MADGRAKASTTKNFSPKGVDVQLPWFYIGFIETRNTAMTNHTETADIAFIASCFSLVLLPLILAAFI